MQNMYEFLMCSASFIPLLTFLSLKIDRQNTLLVDSILTLIVMIPVGFAMDGSLKRLMPALQSPLFIPHVGAYVIGYLILVRAALGAGRRLIGVGFFLLTLGLVLGATWGKICWGNWWQFDPKEMWSLATWFVYSAYFHISNRLDAKQKTVFLTLGAVMIVLTLTWINLSRLFTGMHSYA
jgi:ABC-type transport system involved in cytochrome c biogenesis permease subunit